MAVARSEQNNKSNTLTYKDSGVDVAKGELVAKNLEEVLKATWNKNVIPGVSGYKALFRDGTHTYVSGADGVGTKLKVAFMLGKVDTVGIDLVAMCVNDVIRVGAVPLFFLDYLSTGKLDEKTHLEIVSGIAEGCNRAGVPLLGGETAEMPGFYGVNEFDLAGFAVGKVRNDMIIDGSKIIPGATLLGMGSSGLHSNGYSLARKLFFDKLSLGVNEYVEELGRTVGEELLEPTTIYAKPVVDLLDNFPGHIQGMAHISGGGVPNKLPKCFPKGLGAIINVGGWPVHPIFDYIATKGPVSEEEMRKTFNMGIGMIAVVNNRSAVPEMAAMLLEKHNLASYDIGKIAVGSGVEYLK